MRWPNKAGTKVFSYINYFAVGRKELPSKNTQIYLFLQYLENIDFNCDFYLFFIYSGSTNPGHTCIYPLPGIDQGEDTLIIRETGHSFSEQRWDLHQEGRAGMKFNQIIFGNKDIQ